MTDSDTITIEVDGKPLQARKGQMLIEVTDANDIYVPRFCYHSKLTVAANCRMCLVQVEKAPKPLPACATPVMDGMKVSTRSAYAQEAQKAVMEFLLINHPLDCPICDQGGECELQDLAMGYGSDVSRYQEKKRVVKDKNIGPLVQTEMTRCIHCTRCVRFGEEIAGLRELGATGRGEDMEIGTYIEKSMVSELSGNVIDLCPVGALTSKPFRFSARTWEMTQHPGIAPHDGIGSNLHFHVKADRVKRVVPAENEAINEVWLSDRDRYSYEGMYSNDRLLSPMVREGRDWREIDWETAFDLVKDRLLPMVSNSPQKFGALVSPTSTTEEMFLMQKIVRGLGSNNIDHRIYRSDFSDQDNDPVFPWLGQSIAELETAEVVLLLGAWPRKQQPLLNLRLRKAALRGADIMVINPLDYEFNYRIAEKIIVPSPDLSTALAGVLKALAGITGGRIDNGKLLEGVATGAESQSVAEKLAAGRKVTVLLGNLASAHPQFSAIRYLAGNIARLCNASFGYLGTAANEAGAWLAGAVPHRGPGKRPISVPGLSAQGMLQQGLDACLLFNLEPDLDFWDGKLAMQALGETATVIAMTPYKSAALKELAHIMLPVAIYAENEGSYINVEGKSQCFTQAVPPQGEARPGWKVLRVLGNRLNIKECGYASVESIRTEMDAIRAEISPDNSGSWVTPVALPGTKGAPYRISEVPMNSVDQLVRRAVALQQTADIADGAVHLSPSFADSLGLSAEDKVRIDQQGTTLEFPYVIDNRLPDRTVLIQGGHPHTARLGAAFSPVSVEKGS